MRKEKTLEDFNSEVSRAKQTYLKNKIDFNWNYTFQQEELEGLSYFLITNNSVSTKIIFDHEHKIIIKNNIYSTDIRSILELQKAL